MKSILHVAYSLFQTVLLASGWMFIKPFLSTRDKRIILVTIPLQILANVASAIRNETALGSLSWAYWVSERKRIMLKFPMFTLTQTNTI